MRILLTNDDCQSSPLFAFLIDKLMTLGEVITVVPKYEQSWKAKAKTRFSKLHLEEVKIGPWKVFTLDGTPADCVNIGIYQLSNQKPDMVVSGINAGTNVGLSFIMSSGTIGACFEANIARIPALAFSQALDVKTRREYLSGGTMDEGTIRRLAEQTEAFLDRIFAVLLNYENFFADPITWNFNFPFRGSAQPRIVPSTVGISYYGSSYLREGSHFYHHLTDTVFDCDHGCDSSVVEAGEIAVTPIDVRILGQLPEQTHRELASLFHEA
jgi:5'/3'-nucleotidase